jgi:hypothetical protein
MISSFFRISFITQPEYFRFMYEKDLDQIAEVREFHLASLKNGDCIDELIDYDADYNFFFRGEFANKCLLDKLSGKNIALSSEPFPRYIGKNLVFTKDSLRRYIEFRRQIRTLPFDYIFHYDEASLKLMERDGLHLSGSFAFPVATETYKEQQANKKWDLFFIGRSTDHREKYFGPLKHYFNFLHICHGIYGPSLINYTAQSAICLNVHAEPEVSWEPRMQMLLATGAFVISEKITPNRYLRPGIDYIEATTPIDMKEKVEYYLENEEARQYIATTGRERVIDLLDSKTCFLELIQNIRSGQIRSCKSTRPSSIIELVDGCYRGLDHLKSVAHRFHQR